MQRLRCLLADTALEIEPPRVLRVRLEAAREAVRDEPLGLHGFLF